jgi:tetratricopeptide (TPR) repeat protein
MTARVSRMVCRLLMCLLLAAGCGGSGTGPSPQEDAGSLAEEGWDAFHDADWRRALAKFEAAVTVDSTYGDAHHGMGWCCAKLDSLEMALDHFGTALALGVFAADPYAGSAAVSRDRTPADYEGAITYAESALLIEPRYQFTHDSSFDWRDLRLIIAQSRFGLGEYVAANTEVDSLGGHIQEPNSATFVEDLLGELERLSLAIRD